MWREVSSQLACETDRLPSDIRALAPRLRMFLLVRGIARKGIGDVRLCPGHTGSPTRMVPELRVDNARQPASVATLNQEKYGAVITSLRHTRPCADVARHPDDRSTL